MAIDKAFEIIENNIEEADFFGKICKDKIQKAEEILNIKFPIHYKRFLEKYGAGDIAGIELFGIISDPVTDKEMIPNGVWLTKNLREKYSMPHNLLAIAETGYGPYYVIDTEPENEYGTHPVLMWDSSLKTEKVYNTYGDFLVAQLTEMIES